ncbi:MAG TPA: MFS transporter, partial [Longimicrobiales bacterium]|nr:MFS transporter [Longimicrobiales bacterium]
MSTSLFDASRRPVIVDGVLTQAMSSLVGGAFLAAFALALGASNFQIGLLAAIPALGQLGQLPAVPLIRRVGRRKPVAVGAAAASRVTWFAIAAVPLLAGPDTAFTLIAALLLVASVFGSIGGVAWLSWMRDLIPMESMGRFFARRMQLANGAAVVLSLAGGFFVDLWLRRGGTPALGYSVLFSLGAVLGIGAVLALSRAGEPGRAPPGQGLPGGAGDILHELAEPFRNENFRRLIAFSAAWTCTLTFAAPFYIVYMIERIGLPISTVILLSVVSQAMGILLLPFWGRAVDRFSNSSVLGAAGTILLAAILGWTFTTFPDVHPLTFPLLLTIHLAMGAAMAGITLATGNISLKLSPRGEAESYLTSLGLVNAGVAAASPVAAGALASVVDEADLTLNLVLSEASRSFTLPAVSLRGLDFLFVVAFLLGLYSMHRLAFVQEEGTVDEGVVLEELREQIMEDM